MNEARANAFMDDLLARVGQYSGRGSDHAGRVFLADLTLARAAGGRSVQYRFRAQAMAGNEVYHDESGLIGIGLDGRLALMASSTHYRKVFPRRLARVELIEALAGDPSGVLPPERGGGRSLVFAHGERRNAAEFRDEIKLSLYADGRVGHEYAWGLAGGPFATRSSATLTDVAAVPDERPVYIRHYSQLLEDDSAHYPGSDELLSIGAPIGRMLGLSRIGVHIEVLPTGRRTSFPHAELTEEELVYVIEGFPEVWIDGVMHRLRPGDTVGFAPGTGVAHTFINNAPEPARLLVLGEHRRADNKIWYPLNPERQDQVGEERSWEPPDKALGPHDGLPDARRKR